MTNLPLQSATATPSTYTNNIPGEPPRYEQPAVELSALQRGILETLPLAVMAYRVVSRTEFRVAFMNIIAAGGPEGQAAMMDQPLEALVPPGVVAQVTGYCQTCLDTGKPVEIEDSYLLETGCMWTRSKYLPMRTGQGPITHIVIMWEDVTAQKLREQEELARQQEIIQHQAAALEELSTPLLAISSDTVVLPLVGAIDSQRAQQLLSTLLEGVAGRRARVVILDITGVPIVDTQVANVFLQASQAVGLLGAQVVITGIRPEVAQTMVSLGIDLQRIITRNTLQDGIAFALQR
ncbi:MAG TPA: STAS domain-containing protein [Roseiflexaceae bacterium]|nr:STAS domain-containing protein [Roseiflexaceae bacterium]